MRSPSIVALVTIGLVAASTVRSGAAPAPPVVTAAVAYDRNAFKDSVVVGDTAIALTEAGTLLRFRLPEVVLSGEYSGAVPVACIGERNGIVVAGGADGSVSRVDVSTMTLLPMGKVDGKPVWVSPTAKDRGRAILVVAQGTEPRERTDEDGRSTSYDAHVLHAALLPGGRTFRFEGDFNGIGTFLLAGHRLWIGEDMGEFGGRCGYLDLDGGRQQWYPSGDVYGFTFIDGRVLAFGGITHITLTRGFVASPGRHSFRYLYSQGNFDPKAPEAKPPDDRPILPISAIVPDATKGGLLVFSYDRVFRVDKAFTTWSDAGRLDFHYRTGRPFAVGTYPSIIRVHPLPATGGFLVATRLDGYAVFKDGRAIPKAVAHQPAGSTFDTLVPFGSGIAFVDPALPPSPQYVAAGDWKRLPVFPDGVGNGCWFDGFVTPGRDGSLLMKANSCTNPGLRVLSRWRDGHAEIIHSWEASDWWRDVLETPDGAIWYFRRSGIRRLAHGDWVEASPSPAGGAAAAEGVDDRISTVDLIKLVSESGPPWFVLNRDVTVGKIDRRLVKLSYDARFGSARLTAVRLDSEDRLDVYDAVALDPAHLLLATGDGLRLFDTSTQTVSEPDIPQPPGKVRALARDRRGRVWMGGSGLWMLDGRDLANVGAQMTTAGGEVAAIAADPRSDGVVVLLRRGMILFLATRAAG